MRKDRIGKSLLAASLVGALVAASPAAFKARPAVAAATAQTNQSAGKKAAPKFERVRVSADNIARLPRGENYVVVVSPGKRDRAAGRYTGGTPVAGGVLNSTNAGHNRDLIKTGTGTPVLSGANDSSAADPEQPALLTNRSIAYPVYELRFDRPADFGRVVVRSGAPEAGGPAVPLEAWLRARMPAGAMRKWPFKSVVIGPARGVAQVKGWKADKKPGTNYDCNGETCWCEGAFDCKPLIYSDKCDGDFICGDDDCFCEQKT